MTALPIEITDAPALPSSLTLSIPSRLADVALLGTAIEGVCRRAGMDEATAHQMRLCAAEAANNVIEHGYRLNASHRVDVDIQLIPGSLRMIVTDHGRVIPRKYLKAAREIEFDPERIDLLPVRGMGLKLIHSIMDTVEYQRDGEANRLTMTKGFERLQINNTPL